MVNGVAVVYHNQVSESLHIHKPRGSGFPLLPTPLFMLSDGAIVSVMYLPCLDLGIDT